MEMNGNSESHILAYLLNKCGRELTLCQVLCQALELVWFLAAHL